MTQEDFGSGDFPDDVNDVLRDYFTFPTYDFPDDERPDVEEFNWELLDLEQEGSRNIFEEPMGNEIPRSPVNQEPKLTEEEERFFARECCTNNCTTKFKKDHVLNARFAATEDGFTCRDRVQHNNLRLLGQLTALMDAESLVRRTGSSKERERPTISYMFGGQLVRRVFFFFVNNCGKSKFQRLVNQVKQLEFSARPHGNLGKRAHNTTSADKVAEFSTFMNTFSDIHGLVLPGRIPYRKLGNRDLKLLPSSMTKIYVHTIYSNGTADPMPYNTFTDYWRSMFPNIVIQSPRTDLCAECHRNTIKLQKLHSLSDEVRIELLRRSQEHLETVLEERVLYQTLTKKMDNPPALKMTPPMTFKGTIHYSFDRHNKYFCLMMRNKSDLCIF